MPHAPTEPGGIYLHIPFCVRKCAYCDFYSCTRLDRVPEFMDALRREMRLTARDAPGPFDSVYFGGGTPSTLGPHRIQILLDRVVTSYRLLPNPEITLEANPGTVQSEDFRAYRRAGVNRLNIGVQSFQNRNLRFLGRIHTAEEAIATVDAARRAGFDNLGLDLMYGLPGQSAEAWRFDLKTAISLNPDHLSCYMLSYEPGTPLDRQRRKGSIQPLPDRRVGELFDMTVSVLAAGGYAQYEISNFARSEALQSRHNQKYWNFAPYLGLGPSAHSFILPRRHWNLSDIESYTETLRDRLFPIEAEERLTREQQMIEAFYLGLRQTAGISIADFEDRFGGDFRTRFESLLAELLENGWMRTDPARCALTPKGLLFLDTIVSRFLEEL
ncbi:MAG: radical SAM family heme chaperone HemW [Thermodesulfobacteriota bacterium]